MGTSRVAPKFLNQNFQGSIKTGLLERKDNAAQNKV